MKVLLITVAGASSRFSRSIGRDCLKCIYYEQDIRESLLYRLLHQGEAFDAYVIVGGYRFEELKETLDRDFSDLGGRIILVRNETYMEYGSGYSLFLGLRAAKELHFDELVFAEGDLCIGREGFQKVCMAKGNVVTCNCEPIVADKSVAFYYDKLSGIHYIYDTKHAVLEISEPFLGIFNSGQIWKFAKRERLLEAMARVGKDAWQGTNLCLVQEYFGGLAKGEYELVRLTQWVNCNTIADFERSKEIK